MNRKSFSTLALLAFTVALLLQLTFVTPDVVTPANESSTQPLLPVNGTPVIKDEAKQIEEFKNSRYYLPPFEDGIPALPEGQRAFVRDMVANDVELYRIILREAIEKRNSFAPSVGLMWKYSGKIIGNTIRNRKTELRLDPRKEPHPDFFAMIADLTEKVLDESKIIKKEKGYTKNDVDVEELYKRTDTILQYVQQLIEASPWAGYLRWDKLILFKGVKDTPLIPEASELVAMFRAMGYDKCIFVARRLINLMRMFSKGEIPSEKEV